MKTVLAAAIVTMAWSGTALAQQGEAPEVSSAERCVSPTVLVPPFNNTSGALEQSRIAATTVEDIRQERGEDALRVCRTSATMPELAEIDGSREAPLTKEEYKVLEEAADDAEGDASGA